MGFTRYYSYTCDVGGCHTVKVTEWRGAVLIPEGLPDGWWSIGRSPGNEVLVCPKCTDKVGKEVMVKLFPPQTVESAGLQEGTEALDRHTDWLKALNKKDFMDPTSLLS